MRLSGVNIYWELAFIGSWQYPLLDIIHTSRALPGVLVCSRALAVHPNLPTSEIIRQSRAILCVRFIRLYCAFSMQYPIIQLNALLFLL